MKILLYLYSPGGRGDRNLFHDESRTIAKKSRSDWTRPSGVKRSVLTANFSGRRARWSPGRLAPLFARNQVECLSDGRSLKL